MIKGLIFTIGSFLAFLLLFGTYFSKRSYLSVKNKLYKYLLLTVLILIITEFMASYYFEYGSSNIIFLLLIRIHWITGIIWFYILYLYSIYFLSSAHETSVKKYILENKRCRIYTIFTIIYIIGYFFVPFSGMTAETFNYLPGYATYYVLLYCIISVFAIFSYMALKAKSEDRRKKVSTVIMIGEMFIIFGFQLLFLDIAFMPLGATIQMFFLYFNIENPDLKVIRELEYLKEKINKSGHAKSDFLSNMSHEIRSPMSTIIGFSDSVLNSDDKDVKKAKNSIRSILVAGNNLLDIINNILDISKIESGDNFLELKEYSLANVVMELSSIIDARLTGKNVDLLVDVDKNIPCKLYGDQTKIFQILLNILTNAVKYTEVGKIKLDIKSNVINEDRIMLHFKVSDTGYGIKNEDYDKLFSKFSRLDSATQNGIEGSGLGLVITKSFVDLMNGKIWFESEYEVGTTFYIDLEQKIIDKTPIGAVREPVNNNKPIEYLDCSGRKILLVDDNKLNLKVASKLLNPYHFEVDTATSGEDCIFKIKSGTKYDLIFMDHMMPEMDGIETFHIIKKLEDYDIPPVIALTANAITGMKEMYLEEGFDEYLSKPININELNKIIEKYFK